MGKITKTAHELLDLVGIIILLPFIMLFKLSVVAILFAFLASPIILIGWIVWLIAR